MTADKWESGLFRVTTRTGERKHYCGWFWRGWGISGRRGVWTVYHLPTGYRVTSFTSTPNRRGTFVARRVAKQFCEEIDQLADWPTRPNNPGIELRLHGIALRLTGGRPNLHVVEP